MPRPGRLCVVASCSHLRPCPVHGARPSAAERGYDAAWHRETRAWLVGKTCVVCGAAANVVDHDPPHLGDAAAFWNRETWRPMCTTHHNAKQDVPAGLGSRRLR